MASDILLKIQGVDGECDFKGHEKSIELESFSWGANNPTTGGHSTGGVGGGRVSFTDLHCTALASRAGPLLLSGLCVGKHYDKAELFVRKQGEGQKDFMIVTLNEVGVSDINIGGSNNGGMPHESWTLNFSKINFKYYKQDKSGSMSLDGEFGYDLKKAAKV